MFIREYNKLSQEEKKQSIRRFGKNEYKNSMLKKVSNPEEKAQNQKD
jgi:hypothetical protein